ncbi:putative DNA-binding domain-containing protein [Idiomarina abyssalis]|uniref:HvfC family RiPP maturation protein n=1 Tax=Idiomarina abyssalis TaxID=86102 RepID=UPI002300BD37|nr:putative DNA-binding domain-containing protein [Idiomarina abyssalis]MDA6065550.1 putative DNA-binding domain-containing protein [Idiomarina abyssalis]
MSNDTFKQIQDRFVQQLKDPQKSVEEPWLADIEERRMAIYQRLLRNNIFRFIDSAFPVLKKLCDEEQWQATKEQFFRSFSSNSPYFTGIAKSFVEYLQSDNALFVFAPELAHYEWLELEVEQKPWPESHICVTDELHEEQIIGLNPTAVISAYQYPVDEIGIEFKPERPLSQPRFLVVFRDAEGKVRFVRINAMTYLLLTELQSRNYIRLQDFFDLLPELLPQWPTEQIQEGAEQTLQQFASQQLLLRVKS